MKITVEVTAEELDEMFTNPRELKASIIHDLSAGDDGDYSGFNVEIVVTDIDGD